MASKGTTRWPDRTHNVAVTAVGTGPLTYKLEWQPGGEISFRTTVEDDNLTSAGKVISTFSHVELHHILSTQDHRF